MRDEQTGAGIAREKVLEPLDRFGVEMVGRLVEDEEIGARSSARQSATRRFSPPLSVPTTRSDSGACRFVMRLLIRWSRFQPS